MNLMKHKYLVGLTAFFLLITAGLMYLNAPLSADVSTPDRVYVEVKEGSVNLSNPNGFIDLRASEWGSSEVDKIPMIVPTITPVPVIAANTLPQLRTVTARIIDDAGHAVSDVSALIRSGDKTMASGTSNGEGSVRIDLDSVISQTGTNSLILAVSHEKYFAPKDIGIASTEETASLDVTLQRKLSIAGRVVSASNESLDGVDLFFHPTSSVKEIPADMASSTIRTGTDGRFSFYPVAAGEYIVVATCPGFMVCSQKCQAGREETLITLRKDTVARVRVEDDRGNPVRGANVQMQSQDSSKGMLSFEGITDVMGSVVFEGLWPSHYSVYASDSNALNTASAEIDATTQSEIALTLALELKTFTLSGTALNGVSKKGVVSATIVCEDAGRGIQRRAVTDENGCFVFNGLNPGKYKLYPDKTEGYVSGDFSAFLANGAVEPLTIAQMTADDVKDVTLLMNPSWWIEGTVYDENGKPMEGVRCELGIFVATHGVNLEDDKYQNYTITGADGRYRLEGTYDYDRKSINARVREVGVGVDALNPVDGRQFHTGETVYLPQPGETITGADIHFIQMPLVKGTVVDERGNGIEGARIWLCMYRDEHGCEIYGRCGGYFTKTDKEGRTQTVSVPGTYQYHAEADGYEDIHKKDCRTVTIPETGEIELTVEMRKSDSGIEGQVVGDDGLPIADASLYLRQDSDGREYKPSGYYPGSYIASTDRQGYFSFNPALKEPPYENPVYMITVIPPQSSEYMSNYITGIRPSQKNVTIELQKQGVQKVEIGGRVLDAQGQPVTRFNLLAMYSFHITFDYVPIADEDPFNWHSFYSPHGEFRIDGLNVNQGPFTLAVRNEELGLALSEPVVVEPGQVRKDVEIRFLPPFTAKGKVVDSITGNPIRRVSVLAQIANDQLSRLDENMLRMYVRSLEMRGTTGIQKKLKFETPITSTEDDGTFQIADVPRSSLWLILLTDGYQPHVVCCKPGLDRTVYDMGIIQLQPKDENQRGPLGVKPVMERR